MTVTLDLPPQVEQAYLAEAQARGLSVDDVVREILIAGRPKSVFEQAPVSLAAPVDSLDLRQQYEALRRSIEAEEHGFLDAAALAAEIAERKGLRG